MTPIRASGRKVECKATASSFSQMTNATKESGWQTANMEVGQTSLKTETFTSASTRMVVRMGKGSTSGKVEASTKATFSKASNMDQEN